MPSLFDLYGATPFSDEPTNPFIGAYGPRSLVGRPRGSPVGLPVQAREASPFALTRERMADELDSDPALRQKFDANTTAEVGADPVKRRAYQATVLDRAAATGKPLGEVVNNPDYYPTSTTSKTATTGIGVDPSLYEGANPARFATGNASFDPKTGRWVGFAGGPQTASAGGEIYGIEGGTMPYARAMGYQGPERTAIGPAGPQGLEDNPLTAADNREAYAAALPQGRKMADDNGLMSMFQPRDMGGQSTDFGNLLAQRQNSLIGLGLGLMAGTRQDPYGAAMRGYAQGAASDQDRYQAAQNLTERRADRAQAQRNWEQQFQRSGESDFAKIARDLQLKPGSPEYVEAARKYTLDKTEPPTITWQEDANGNKVPYLQNPRSATNPLVPLSVPGATSERGNPYAAGGKMTQDEGKTALFADRAASAHDAITKAENLNAEPGGKIGALIQQNLPAGAANVLVSGERGKAMDAQRAFINALLRRESGAAISSGEFDSYGKEYFPQLGDTAEQIDAKRQHRAEVIAGLAREGGKGYRPSYSFDDKGFITRGKPSYADKGAPAPAGGDKPPAKPDSGDKGGNAAVLDDARAAIKRGAPRDAVIKRLRDKGIDPEGL